MTDIAAVDWGAMERLSRRLGLPDEAPRLLRKRLTSVDERPGNPYVLLAGRAGAGLELLLGRWLMPELAESLEQADGRPLIIGPTPNEVRPSLGSWPTFEHSYPRGHLLAMLSPGKVSSSTLAQLSSIGFIDTLVLVSRLGQPLHERERELAKSLCTVVATVKVLFVGIPGEEPTSKDISEVSAFAVSQMRQAGFDGGRCLGASVWFAGGSPIAGTLSQPDEFVVDDPGETEAGRNGMARSALQGLMKTMGDKVQHHTEDLAPPVAESERERLIGELDSYLKDLGHELDTQGQSRPTLTTADMHKYAMDAFRSWGAYTSVEGHWMKYVERLRPGIQNRFLTEADAALGQIEFEPGIAKAANKVRPPSPIKSWIGEANHWALEAKKAGIGLVAGLACYMLVSSMLDSGAVRALAGIVTFVVCGILGYALSERFLGTEAAATGDEDSKPGVIHGWSQVERRLVTWFSDAFQAQAQSAMEEYETLRKQLSLEEESA